MDWCADATVKEMPSHRSQCGGFAVSQNRKAQSSHAYTRCRFLLFILLTINDRPTLRDFWDWTSSVAPLPRTRAGNRAGCRLDAGIIRSKLYTIVAAVPTAHRVAGNLNPRRSPKMKKNIWRAIIEVSFIVFLFYSNLLMGEFERSGMGEKRGLWWAMGDVLTSQNFAIALIAALVGYLLFEFLRTRF
jgi:hypothetical protein